MRGLVIYKKHGQKYVRIRFWLQGIAKTLGDLFSAPEKLERVKGIEPSSHAWEARILPLNHTRVA